MIEITIQKTTVRPIALETGPEIAMIATTPKPKISLEEFLALPDDGVDRELIRGEIRENGMTLRNHRHGNSESLIAYELVDWIKKQNEPSGIVVTGDTGFLLSRDPETFVGPDVAYVSAENARKTPRESTFFESPPVLAVEILSPSNDVESIHEKIRLYLESGVRLVWIVDPEFRTVVVHRADAPPTMFNAEQEIHAEPFLPGFRAQVVKFFEI